MILTLSSKNIFCSFKESVVLKQQNSQHHTIKKGAISTFKTRSSQINGKFKVQDAVESVNPSTPTSDRQKTSPLHYAVNRWWGCSSLSVSYLDLTPNSHY